MILVFGLRRRYDPGQTETVNGVAALQGLSEIQALV
jgi:hypothetical protein